MTNPVVLRIDGYDLFRATMPNGGDPIAVIRVMTDAGIYDLSNASAPR
jgi:hypothetical protein